MKLTKFNDETAPKLWGGGGSTLPKISFGKAGTISFNRAAVMLLDLKGKDKVSLAQDEEEPGNWYVFKDPKNGFELRDKDFAKSGNMTFNHKSLQKSFCESFDFPVDKTKCLILAGEPTEVKGDKTKYWGLLISGQ